MSTRKTVVAKGKHLARKVAPYRLTESELGWLIAMLLFTSGNRSMHLVTPVAWMIDGWVRPVDAESRKELRTLEQMGYATRRDKPLDGLSPFWRISDAGTARLLDPASLYTKMGIGR